jgi:hypothetical protein
MAREIEWIATCLWSAAEELTLPLNATKGSKLTSTSVGWDQIVQQDGVQFTCSPFLATHGRYAKLLTIVIINPSCKF